MSEFNNWEPVDNNDQTSAHYDVGSSDSPATVRGSDNDYTDRYKASRSPIRSLQNSSRNSITSVDNQGLKSSPADPHLTALDPITGVTSSSSKNGSALSSVNQIIVSTKDAKDLKETKDLEESKELAIPEDEEDVSNNSFFNSMLTSLSFKGSTSSAGKPIKHLRTSSDSSAQPVPNIISYRKATPSKKSRRSVSNDSNVPSSPLQEMEKPDEVVPEFNKKFYVEERFAGTIYHYATEERNAELHRIFKSVPDSDRLLDDFSCALSREFLFQGRIYVTESNICFNSNLLGWVTHIVVSMKDISLMEKTSTAGLFPNGISIETRLGRHQFVSFISRDATFEFIKAVWSKYKGGHLGDSFEATKERPLSGPGGDLRRSHSDLIATTLTTVSPHEPPSRSSIISENNAIIEDAILSVDDIIPTIQFGGDITLDDNNDNYYDDEDDEDDNDNELNSDENDEEGESCHDDKRMTLLEKGEASTSASNSSSIRNTNYPEQKAYSLKVDSGFEYDGPGCFHETKFSYKPEDNNETILADKEFNAPPGVIYQLMFSGTKPDFLAKFLEGQNSSNLSPITAFDNVNNDGDKYRKYNYSKALNFSVGPKSTNCEVTESLLSMDYENVIDVVNATKTPDVPSGNNFIVKTRYMLRWASENTSNLKISFWIEWTGGSWIKSVIEKSCKTGQIQATAALIDLLDAYVEKFVSNSATGAKQLSSKKQAQSRRLSRISSKSEKPAVTSPVETSNIPTSANIQPDTGFFFPSITTILVCVNLVLLVAVLWRQQQILSLLQNKTISLAGESVGPVNQMVSHFKALFEADAENILLDGSDQNGSLPRFTIKDWIDKHGGSEEAFNFDLQKKRQYQRYMRYIVDQLIDGEVSVSETEDFLYKLDKLVSLVNNTKNNTDGAAASELRNAINYLINA
ncbi:LAME_0A07668g1_1 [Lachancea meyersii CBS 8951]|uniref:LAME_0A07668g1_1 n=1 Tax=Lachancea meyersii CBS 8951 TaxID=1266667 RepID=A0A1G4IQY1_9SACH|nr:LAME_0A07668g1_1 [Lachancea meyersii CBS 8951]